MNPADAALAQRLTLSLADFPPGWTSKPHTNSNSDKTDKLLSACMHIPNPKKLISDAANADSPDFTSPSAQQVSSNVGVAKTSADVTKVLNLMSSPSLPDCFAQAFDSLLRDHTSGSTLPKGTTLGTTRVNPESFEALGGRTVAYRITVPISANGVNASVYVDFVVVQKGRVGILFIAESPFEPFPPTTSASLVRKVLARAATVA